MRIFQLYENLTKVNIKLWFCWFLDTNIWQGWEITRWILKFEKLKMGNYSFNCVFTFTIRRIVYSLLENKLHMWYAFLYNLQERQKYELLSLECHLTIMALDNVIRNSYATPILSHCYFIQAESELGYCVLKYYKLLVTLIIVK